MTTIYAINDGERAFSDEQAALIESIAERLVRQYEGAPEDIRSQGAKWYTGKGAQLAQDVAEECGISVETAAAVVAVCSPRTRWSMQVRNTAPMVRHLLDGGTPATAPAGSLFVGARAKALAILEGDMAPLSGPKVGPFYRNLTGDWSVITLDVWAIRAALVGSEDMSEAEVDRWAKGTRRSILEAAYHRAAEMVGIEVAALQAVVWVVVRGAVD